LDTSPSSTFLVRRVVHDLLCAVRLRTDAGSWVLPDQVLACAYPRTNAALGAMASAGVLLSAFLFGVYHLMQSDHWAMGAVFTFLMPCLGGVLFGYAAVTSNGLALPLGLHLGGNWVQSALAGFAPLGSEAPLAMWQIPLSVAAVQTLTAPDLLPRLPYIAGVTLAAVVVWAMSRSQLRQR
jgi:uncharacterized protein